MPSLYLEIRFFLDDISELVQPWTNRSSKASLPRLMDGGRWKWKLVDAALCKAGMPCQRSERSKFLLTSASWSPNFLGLNKTSRHRYMSIFHSLPFFEPLHWSEFDVSLFHLFDRLSLATWLDRLPHVETPFHGWNMLKCCFGLSSFEWPP